MPRPYSPYVTVLCVMWLITAGNVAPPIFAQDTPPNLPSQAEAAQARQRAEEMSRALQEENTTRRGRGRGGRRSFGEQPIVVEPPETSVNQRGGSGGRGGAAFGSTQTNLEAALDDSAVDVVAMNVWVLTVSATGTSAGGQLGNEPIADLVARAKGLPVTLGSRDDVRDWISKLQVAGVLERVREFRLTAVSGQSASVQNGETIPQVTSTSQTEFGRVNSLQMTSVGTIVQVQPRIDAEGQLKVAINYSSSSLEKSNEVALSESRDGSNRMMASRVVNQQYQSTVRLKTGAAALVNSDTTSQLAGDSAGVRMQLVILAAEIVQ
jgi:hypothetical protein